MEKPLTQHIKNDGTWLTLHEYEKIGGYQALKQALKLEPKDIIKTVKDSGLKGRGGAGFSTGTKWGLIHIEDNSPTTRYFIANADEMEPGSFKDRFLLEGNPHQLIEGLIIGAYAIQLIILPGEQLHNPYKKHTTQAIWGKILQEAISVWNCRCTLV